MQCTLFAILGLMLGGCTTPSINVSQGSEIFRSIPKEDAAKIAVFTNWIDSCQAGLCKTDPAGMRAQVTQCISSGFRAVNPGIEAIDTREALAQDTSALLRDPRKFGAPDQRITGALAERLTRRGISYALIVDSATSTSEPRRTPGLSAERGFIAVNRESSEIYTRTYGLLVNVATRQWIVRIESTYKGSASSGGGLAGNPLVIPFFYALRSSTEKFACESIGRRVAAIVTGGTDPGGATRRE